MDVHTGGLVRLTRQDRNAAAAVLGSAFAEYDLLRYYYPDKIERSSIAETFCFIALSVCLRYGEVYASSAKLEGISAWLPPGKAPFGLLQIMRSVPLSVLYKFGRQGAKRMQDYGKYVDTLHHKLVPYPHWYLQIIGVDPAYQGQGISSRLIKPMLERIDREHMPCYVETNTEKNVSIYRRFGFEVVSEDTMPGTDVTNFAMLRKAHIL